MIKQYIVDARWAKSHFDKWAVGRVIVTNYLFVVSFVFCGRCACFPSW